MLLVQLLPVPKATCTWRQAGEGVSGCDGRKRMGRESPPCGRPHTKLDPTDVISSSSHAKKLAVYLIHIDGTWTSKRGGGQWTITSLPNSLPLFHMLMSMSQKTTTFAEVTQHSVEYSYNIR